MEQSTIATIIAAVGVVATVLGYLHAMKKDLQGKIDMARAEAKADNQVTRDEAKGEIAEFRDEVRANFAAIRNSVDNLERRTYDLASRLPPVSAGPADG